MNILSINYEFPPIGGGGGVVFEQICAELTKHHNVTVITSAYEGLKRFEERGALRIHRVPVLWRKSRSTATMPSMLSFWPSSEWLGRRLLRQEAFDVINSHFVVPSSPSAARLARRFGLPHVVSIHGGDIFDPSKITSPHRLPLVRSLVKKLLRQADRVVAQSRNTADNARKYYGTQRSIDLIPLGIRPAMAGESLRAELGIENDKFVMITVGRLVARKNISQLLNAISQLNDGRDLLVVLGDGPMLNVLQEEAVRLGIADRVRFEGYVDKTRKLDWLASSDLFVSTSLHEGFGLVFLEAMDHGLGVVAYNHGGQADFLEDGKTGSLVSVGDEGQFTNAIRRFKATPGKRQEISQFNHKRAQEYYVDRCASRYEELFEQVIASHRSQSRGRCVVST